MRENFNFSHETREEDVPVRGLCSSCLVLERISRTSFHRSPDHPRFSSRCLDIKFNGRRDRQLFHRAGRFVSNSSKKPRRCSFAVFLKRRARMRNQISIPSRNLNPGRETPRYQRCSVALPLEKTCRRIIKRNSKILFRFGFVSAR